jgi:hypothetical protein
MAIDNPKQKIEERRMRGICTVCQSVKAVRQLLLTVDEDWHDEADFWIMTDHNCEGTGTTPQALIKDNE